MKITGFNPMVLTPDPEPAVRLFEELGFERRHIKEGINNQGITEIRMKNADGNHLDVIEVAQLPQAIVATRINVDNFEEAREMLTAHGFTNAFGGKAIDTGSSIFEILKAPSGAIFDLAQHIKD